MQLSIVSFINHFVLDFTRSKSRHQSRKRNKLCDTKYLTNCITSPSITVADNSSVLPIQQSPLMMNHIPDISPTQEVPHKNDSTQGILSIQNVMVEKQHVPVAGKYQT